MSKIPNGNTSYQKYVSLEDDTYFKYFGHHILKASLEIQKCFLSPERTFLPVSNKRTTI